MLLGYVLSADGISANPEKVEKLQIGLFHLTRKRSIHFWSWPLIISTLFQSLLQFQKCLHELVGSTNIKKDRKANADTSKDSNFQWTDKHQKVFNLLKACLTSVPVLGYPDFNHPFNPETDSSLQGLGAVLSQKDEHGQSKVIAYASQSL